MATQKQRQEIEEGILIPCKCNDCPTDEDVGKICTANKTIFTDNRWFCYKGQMTNAEAISRKRATNTITEENIARKRKRITRVSRHLTQEEIAVVPNIWTGRNQDMWTEENEKTFQLSLAN